MLCYDLKNMKSSTTNKAKQCTSCKAGTDQIRNEMLFKQPDAAHLGACPICFLPLPLDQQQAGKIICLGCDYANALRMVKSKQKCVCCFCRQPGPATQKEEELAKSTRVKASDPLALQLLGAKHRSEGDYKSAFKYWSMAADLGNNAEAHYQLSLMFAGHGVEQNETMFLHHSIAATIGGHHVARYNLGCYEKENHRMTRAVSNFLIGANLGCDDALSMLKELYSQGFVKKDDSVALRSHQAAVTARKSPERALAEEVIRIGKALSSTILTETSSHHVHKN